MEVENPPLAMGESADVDAMLVSTANRRRVAAPILRTAAPRGARGGRDTCRAAEQARRREQSS